MKPFNLLIISFVIASIMINCTPNKKIIKQEKIEWEDIVLYTNRDGVMYFDTNKTKLLHGFTGDSIVHYYSYLFDIGEHNEWRLKHFIYKERESFGNYTTYIYEVYHKGYPINKNVFYFDVKNGQIFRAKGILNLTSLNIDIDTTIIITTNEAENKALNDMPKNMEVWQTRTYKKIKKVKNEYLFVYAISIWTLSPMNHQEVLIDPKNGEVLANYSLTKY